MSCYVMLFRYFYSLKYSCHFDGIAIIYMHARCYTVISHFILLSSSLTTYSSNTPEISTLFICCIDNCAAVDTLGILTEMPLPLPKESQKLKQKDWM